MTNPNKQKGNRWEALVVSYLRSHGIHAERIRGSGAADRGDIHVDRTMSIEAKDHAKPAWWQFVAQANRGASNAGFPYGVAVQKKRNRPVEEALVVMDLRTLAMLLKHIQRLSGCKCEN